MEGPDGADRPSRLNGIQRHFVTHGPTYGFGGVLAAIFAILIGLVAWWGVEQRSADVDGEFRDRAVDVRMAEVFHLTNGEIQVIRESRDYSGYGWDGSKHQITVPLKVGGCTYINGIFLSRNRPENSEALSVLYVEVITHRHVARVAVTSPTLFSQLRQSDKGYCVTGR